MKDVLYIYDYGFDDSISFLNKLTESLSKTVATGHMCNRLLSHSKINRAIKDCDEIWMLGHGGPDGLYSKPKFGVLVDFDRYLISSRNVQFMRDKACVGIWCHANKFAEKYKLSGLFSGMILSEQVECGHYLGYTPSKETIDACNNYFVKSLRYCLSTLKLYMIPKVMKGLADIDGLDRNIIEYNFNNIHFYIKGEIVQWN